MKLGIMVVRGSDGKYYFSFGAEESLKPRVGEHQFTVAVDDVDEQGRKKSDTEFFRQLEEAATRKMRELGIEAELPKLFAA